MNDAELIEQLLVRIACLFEDTSAVLLHQHNATLADRVGAAQVAVDRASAMAKAADTIARLADIRSAIP